MSVMAGLDPASRVWKPQAFASGNFAVGPTWVPRDEPLSALS
jgi:hypothetical protein